MTQKPYPLKAKVPIGYDKDGKPMYPSADFIRNFDAYFKRLGEYTALSNTELEALSRAEKLGVFGARGPQPLKVKQGTGPLTVTQDITGFTVSVNMDQIIGAVRAFMPRAQETKQPTPNNAQWVIANRIFRG